MLRALARLNAAEAALTEAKEAAEGDEEAGGDRDTDHVRVAQRGLLKARRDANINILDADSYLARERFLAVDRDLFDEVEEAAAERPWHIRIDDLVIAITPLISSWFDRADRVNVIDLKHPINSGRPSSPKKSSRKSK